MSHPANHNYSSRRPYLLATLALFLTETLIAIFIHDHFIRPYIGDVLVVILIYVFLRIFLPNGLPHLPFYIFLFGTFVEVMQYFHIVEILGLQGNTVARIIIGSSFDWKDIICYGVGCLILFGSEKVMENKHLE